MSKVIVVKKEDGGVVLIYPSELFGEEEGQRPFSSCPALLTHIEQGRSWFICDSTEIQNLSNRESRKQLYHDGDTVKVDKNWGIRLMPSHCIKSRHIESIDTRIDALLSSNVTDPMEVVKYQREKEKCLNVKCKCPRELRLLACECGHDEFWYDIALKNLDKRVAKGESDKPLIRQKLNKQIKKFKE